MIYDVIIIGTGPAGFSAALNLKIHEKNFLWFGNPDFSDKIRKAELIGNYPGLDRVSGKEMAEVFQKQAQNMKLNVLSSMVNSILPMGKTYAVMAADSYYETKTIILATGVTIVSMLPGEQPLIGRGVSYCATCDGGLYRDKNIAVVCTNERFEHEVNYLARLAGRVYLDARYRSVGSLEDNVILLSSPVVGIEGEQRVSAITLKEGGTLAVEGVFCLRESVSMQMLLPGLMMENGHILVDRAMRTNLSGVFAAGDCTGRPYQYIKAAGEGNVAAHSVISFLAK